MEIPNLKYGGTALFLLGISWRLIRWVVGTITEDDSPPGDAVDISSALPEGHPLIAGGSAVSAHPAQSTQSPFDRAAATRTDTSPWSATDPEAPPPAGDPTLFPQPMLDAMTPEERDRVQASLLRQHAARSKR